MTASVQGGSFVFLNTGNVNVGAPTAFTDPNGNFQTTDVGANIAIKGAGVAGADLKTTIAAFVSNHAVTLTTGASTTVVNQLYVTGFGGTLSSNWTTTMSVTLASAQSIGDGIAVGANDDQAHSTPTIADSAGNTYSTPTTQTNVTYTQTISATHVGVASAGGANTITFTYSALEAGFSAAFYRHFSNTGPVGQVKQGNSSGTAITTGNFTNLVLKGSVIWGFTGADGAISAGAPGFTVGPHNDYGDIEEYLIVVTTGSFAVTATQSNSTFVVSGITFQPPVTTNAFFFNSD